MDSAIRITFEPGPFYFGETPLATESVVRGATHVQLGFTWLACCNLLRVVLDELKRRDRPGTWAVEPDKLSEAVGTISDEANLALFGLDSIRVAYEGNWDVASQPVEVAVE